MDSTQSGGGGGMLSTVSISSQSDEHQPRIEPQQQRKGCFPVRYNLMILGWFATAAAYSLRSDLSIAMVAMVNQTFAGNVEVNHTHDFTSFCPSPYNKSSDPNENFLVTGDIDWTPSQQGVVLAAFFVGYFGSQIPWGIITQKVGGKGTVGYGLFVCAILSFMTPPAAETSFILAVMTRGLMGVAQGSVYPGLMSLMGKWVPLGQRSKFSTVIGVGSGGGAIFSTFFTAFFSEHPNLGGWHTPFYIFGGVVCIWFIFWMTSMYNFPTEHPRISREELKYIEDSIASATPDETDYKVPWGSILKSLSIWSLCILLFCNSWLFYVILTFMPTYMEVILGLDMDDNGIYSSLPYLGATFTSVLGGIMADYMINRKVKVNTTRKLMVSIGFIPQSLALLSIAFLGCRSDLVIMMFILTTTLGAISDAGTAVSIIDIAPRYSGPIYGIVNCASNFSGVLAPLVTGYIINIEETLDQWKKVFFLASGLNLFGVFVFLLAAKVEKAPWADGNQPREEEKEKLIDPTSDSIESKKYGTIVS